MASVLTGRLNLSHDDPGLAHRSRWGAEQVQLCFFSIESVFLLSEHSQTLVRVA